MQYATLLLSALAAVSALPLEERQSQPFQVVNQQPWNAGAVNEWQIHPSCNGSQRAQLQKGLDEAVELATHAKAHINRWGNESAIYRRWFGNRPTVEAIGSLDILINGDRRHALFRCDDPDGNCVSNPTYGGHYRGRNATEETVICGLSFRERQYNSQICSRGWNARTSSRLLYWSSDLIHRLYHLPAFGQGYIDHYTTGYANLTAAAAANSANSTHDSDGIQYFALEAYAFDIIEPGVGCPGTPAPAGASSASAAAATSAPASAASSSAATAAAASQSYVATVVASPTPAQSATRTATGGANCHTHADGMIHCV